MYFAGLLEPIDIILPAYNPLQGWEDIVITRFLSLQNQFPDHPLQLIIVNDGSTTLNEIHSTEKIIAQIPSLNWISYTANRGKGFALREGVRSSSSPYIVYTDIDWPYEEKSMKDVIQALLDGADAVIGVRNEEYYKHLPPWRRRISKLLKKFNASLLKLKVNDTQAGLKGFRFHLKDIFLKTTINRYLFDLEFIYLISGIKNIKVTGLPISLRSGITFSKMNRNILFQEARNFLKIWLRP